MDKEGQVFICSSSEQIADFAVRKWMELAFPAIREGGDFTVALSGGKTPVLFYQKLASQGDSLPWESTHIFWADERFVPPDSKLSNYRLVKETLFSHIPIPQENIHAVPANAGSPQIEGKENRLPAAMVNPFEGELLFAVEEGAASKLPIHHSS